MKKILAIGLLICMGLFLVSCGDGGGNASNGTGDEGPDERLQIEHPQTLGSIDYKIGGGWAIDEYPAENMKAYETGFFRLLMAYGDVSEPNELLLQMLVAEGHNPESLVMMQDAEEIEVAGVTGFRQGFSIGGNNSEFFAFGVGTTFYAMVSIYSNPELISTAHDITDQVLVSINVSPDAIDPDIPTSEQQ